MALSESTRGCSTCRRLKASSWRVSAAARWPAWRICSRSPRIGSLAAELLEDQLAVAQDPGEQVVEVVRDPARELAHRLHLLRVTELLLAPAGAPPRRRADRVMSWLTTMAPTISPSRVRSGTAELRIVFCAPSKVSMCTHLVERRLALEDGARGGPLARARSASPVSAHQPRYSPYSSRPRYRGPPQMARPAGLPNMTARRGRAPRRRPADCRAPARAAACPGRAPPGSGRARWRSRPGGRPARPAGGRRRRARAARG